MPTGGALSLQAAPVARRPRPPTTAVHTGQGALHETKSRGDLSGEQLERRSSHTEHVANLELSGLGSQSLVVDARTIPVGEGIGFDFKGATASVAAGSRWRTRRRAGTWASDVGK